MKLQSGFLGLAAILAVSCSDRTPEQWCREKVEQEVARIQEVSGSYAGTLLSGQDGRSMGELTVEVEPDVIPGDMKSCSSSEVEAVARGRIVLVQGGAKLLSFSAGRFNSASGALSASIKRPAVLGEEAQLSLSGTLSGGRFVGRLEAAGYPEGGGTFSLKRNGPVVASLPSSVLSGSGAGLPTGETASRSYKGRLRYADGTEEDATLVLLTVEGTAGEEFFYSFLPARPAQVTIRLAPGAQVSFQNAQWDTRTGRLRGSSVGQSPIAGGPAGGVSQYEISLDCYQTVAPTGWSCRYYSNQYGLLFVGTFTGGGT